MIKKEIRVIGIDDSPFVKSDEECLVVGAIFRGGNYIDGVVSCSVEIDGNNATENLSEMINKTRHRGQLNCIMINGIAVGGFNVVDIQQLSRKTKLPVIVVVRKMPSFKEIRSALQRIKSEKKMDLIRNAGEIHSVKIKERRIYFQIAGISAARAAEIIRITSTHSLIPEPIRVAHLMAGGIASGESKGRA